MYYSILYHILSYTKNLYKNHTKCTQKSHKIVNLYIFCIQILCKSKFHMIMNVQEMCIKFLPISKNVQTAQHSHKVQTENSLKLVIYVYNTFIQY